MENTLRGERAAQAARFHPAPLVARHAHHLIVLPVGINQILTRHIRRKKYLLESHLEKNTDLDFSHAICPERTRKLYPEKSR